MENALVVITCWVYGKDISSTIKLYVESFEIHVETKFLCIFNISFLPIIIPWWILKAIIACFNEN